MKYPTLITLFLAFVFASSNMFAQEIDYGTATVTEEYCVSLDTELPIAEYYTIDISHLHLITELEAVNKFGFISNNLLTYKVNFADETVYLHVHLDRTTTPKDIHWWNEYVESLCGL